MKFAGRAAPELIEWVTPACEPGVRGCFEALGQLDGAREAVMGAGVSFGLQYCPLSRGICVQNSNAD
ncbi:hypothetical protein [Bradyrhizobium cenepequi]